MRLAGFDYLSVRGPLLAVTLAWIGATSTRSFGVDFAVDRSVISSGGGTSTNGAFSITGTLGQPDAGPRLTGGVFTVDGGFWGAVTLQQTPGAPLLTLQHLKVSGTLFFSWPITAESYVLDSSPLVGPAASWTPVSASVQLDGQHRTVTLPQQPGQRYFRLRQAPPP